MKKILLILLIVLLTSCSKKKDVDEILQNKFQAVTYSANFEKPAIDLEENNLKEILVLLHDNMPEEKIKKHFKLNDSVYAIRINDLFGNGLIKKSADGSFVPACMVINLENGNQIKKTADSLGKEISGIAMDRYEKIKSAYSKIPAFKNISFENASMFILGNVIHNFWQMKFIEEKYLKAFPPKRGDSKYYLSIIEKIETGKEPFGLYLNKFNVTAKYTYGNYGNTTTSALPASQKEVETIVTDKNSSIIIVKNETASQLENLAAIVTDDLLSYLEKNRPLFVKLYLNSVYKDQTSFREWFVWFYQFIIAKTVNVLLEKNFIHHRSINSSSFILVKQ
jgi:hypothetical protein